MENEQLLSRSAAAELLQVSTYTIERLEKRGKLHPVRLSKNTVRIKRSELMTLIAEGSQSAPVVPEQLKKA